MFGAARFFAYPGCQSCGGLTLNRISASQRRDLSKNVGRLGVQVADQRVSAAHMPAHAPVRAPDNMQNQEDDADPNWFAVELI